MPWRFISVLFFILLAFSCGFIILATMGGFESTSGLWSWFRIYRDGIRTPMFTGFLTVGSFLLTLKATILLRIKEIYDTPDYWGDWHTYQEQRRLNNKPPTGYYDPLRNLGHGLLANVLLALTTSVIQVTLGFVNAPWAVGICLGFAATTLGLLLFLWWQIAQNLNRWFSVIERERSGKPPKAKE